MHKFKYFNFQRHAWPLFCRLFNFNNHVQCYCYGQCVREVKLNWNFESDSTPPIGMNVISVGIRFGRLVLKLKYKNFLRSLFAVSDQNIFEIHTEAFELFENFYSIKNYSTYDEGEWPSSEEYEECEH